MIFSPSDTIFSASASQAFQTASANSTRSSRGLLSPTLTPEWPLASMSTVSLVLMSPSTVMQLKVPATASESVFCRKLRGTEKSVARKASMVAMLGWIMPAPFAMPETKCFLPS